MVPQKARHLRTASSLVTAEYYNVRLIPRDSQTLISAFFETIINNGVFLNR